LLFALPVLIALVSSILVPVRADDPLDVGRLFDDLDGVFKEIPVIQRSVQEVLRIVDKDMPVGTEDSPGNTLQPVLDAYMSQQLSTVYELAQDISRQYADGKLQNGDGDIDGAFFPGTWEILTANRKMIDLDGDPDQLLYPGEFNQSASVIVFPAYDFSSGATNSHGLLNRNALVAVQGEAKSAKLQNNLTVSSVLTSGKRVVAWMRRRFAGSMSSQEGTGGGSGDGSGSPGTVNEQCTPLASPPLENMLSRALATQSISITRDGRALLERYPGLSYRVTEKMRELALLPFSYKNVSIGLSPSLSFIASDGSARLFPYTSTDNLMDGRYLPEVRAVFGAPDAGTLVLVYDASRSAGRLRRDYSRKLLVGTLASVNPALPCDVYALGEEARLVYRGRAGDADFNVLSVDTLIGKFPTKQAMYSLLVTISRSQRVQAAVFFLSGLRHTSNQLKIHYLPSHFPIHFVQTNSRPLESDMMELFLLYRHTKCEALSFQRDINSCLQQIDVEMRKAAGTAEESSGQDSNSVRYTFQESAETALGSLDDSVVRTFSSEHDVLGRGMPRRADEFSAFSKYVRRLSRDMKRCLSETVKELDARYYDASDSLLSCTEYESCDLRDELAPLLFSLLQAAPVLSLKVPGPASLAGEQVNYLSVPVFRQTKDTPLNTLLAPRAQGAPLTAQSSFDPRDFLGVVAVTLRIDQLLPAFSIFWPILAQTRDAVLLFDRLGTAYYNSDQGNWVGQGTYQQAYSPDFFRSRTTELDLSGSTFHQRMQLVQRNAGLAVNISNLYVSEKSLMNILGDEQLKLSGHRGCQRIFIAPYGTTGYDKVWYDVSSGTVETGPLDYCSYFGHASPYLTQSELTTDNSKSPVHYEIAALLPDEIRDQKAGVTQRVWEKGQSGVYDDRYTDLALEWCSSAVFPGLSMLYVSVEVFGTEKKIPTVDVHKLEHLEQQYNMPEFKVQNWIKDCHDPIQTNYPEAWHIHASGEYALYASDALATAKNSEGIGFRVQEMMEDLITMRFSDFKEYLMTHAYEHGLYRSSGPAPGKLLDMADSTVASGKAAEGLPEFVALPLSHSLELIVPSAHLIRKRLVRLVTASASTAYGESGDADGGSLTNFAVLDATGIIDEISCKIVRKSPFSQTRAGFDTKTHPRVIHYKESGSTHGSSGAEGDIPLLEVRLKENNANSNMDRASSADLLMRILDYAHCVPLSLHSELYSINAKGLHRCAMGRNSLTPLAQYEVFSFVVPVYSASGQTLYGSLELTKDMTTLRSQIAAVAEKNGCPSDCCETVLLDRHARVLLSSKLWRDLGTRVRVAVGKIEEFENRQCSLSVLDNALLDLLFYNGLLLVQADIQAGRVCSDFFIPDVPFGATVGTEELLQDGSVLELSVPDWLAEQGETASQDGHGRAFLHRLEGTDVYALVLVDADWYLSSELSAPGCYSSFEDYRAALLNSSWAKGTSFQGDDASPADLRWRPCSWDELRVLPGPNGSEPFTLGAEVLELSPDGSGSSGGRVVGARGRPQALEGLATAIPVIFLVLSVATSLGLAAAHTQGCLRARVVASV